VRENDISPPTEVPLGQKMNHSVRDARCVPLEEVHRLYAPRYAGGSATLARDLAPRPRVLKVLVIDNGLPPPVDLFSSPVDIGEDVSRLRNLGANWLEAFKQIVSAEVRWSL